MRNKQIRKVAELEQIAPPVPPLDALRDNLLYTMFNAVKPDSLARIIAKQQEMAEAGNHKSAQFIRDMIQAGGGVIRQAPTMQQNVLVNNAAGADKKGTVFISDLRRQIVALIAAEGPKNTVFFSERLHTSQPLVLEALDYGRWFEKEPDGWHATSLARSEALVEAVE